MNAGKALGNAALSPFWALGRLFNLVAVAALWVWQAFLDGLRAGTEDRSNGLDVLFLFWLIALTVWMAL